ncbi:hypothetical protein [Lacrimispora sp.]|uniref:hypothetical protein n=1 Tax=Lacrimispora sp. TaxID=2719234 RepID=UPI0039E34384
MKINYFVIIFSIFFLLSLNILAGFTNNRIMFPEKTNIIIAYKLKSYLLSLQNLFYGNPSPVLQKQADHRDRQSGNSSPTAAGGNPACGRKNTLTQAKRGPLSLPYERMKWGNFSCIQISDRRKEICLAV